MPNLEYKVKFTLEQLEAFNKIQEDLKNQTAKVQQLTEAYNRLADSFKKAQNPAGAAGGGGGPFKAMEEGIKNLLGKIPVIGSTIQHISEPIGQMAEAFKKASGVGGMAAGAIAGGLAGIATAAVTASHAIAEFAGFQTRLAKLDAVLANNGLMTEAYREKLVKLSEQFQDTTGVASERWLTVLQRLTQFGAKPENIDKYATAVKNLAGIMGGSVERAGMIFTRIMQGHSAGLARWGLNFQHTGDKAKDFAAAVAQINEMGTGVMESQLTTINGLMTNLKNQSSEVMKNLGAKISETGFFQQVLKGWGMGLAWIKEKTNTKLPGTEGIENKGETVAPSMGHDEEEMHKYKLTQEEAAQSIRMATEAVHAQREALELHYKSIKDIIDAQKELSMAQLDSADGLSPVERVERKQAIEAKHEADVYNNDRARRQAELQNAKDLLDATGTASTMAFQSSQKAKKRIEDREKAAQEQKVAALRVAALDKEAEQVEKDRAPDYSPFAPKGFGEGIAGGIYRMFGGLNPSQDTGENYKNNKRENAKRKERRDKIPEELKQAREDLKKRNEELEAFNDTDSQGTQDTQRLKQAIQETDKKRLAYEEAVQKYEQTVTKTTSEQAAKDAERVLKLAAQKLHNAIEEEKVAREVSVDKEKSLETEAELVSKMEEQAQNYQAQQSALDDIYESKKAQLMLDIQSAEAAGRATEAKRAELANLQKENDLRKAGVADQLKLLDAEKKIALELLPKARQGRQVRHEIERRLGGGDVESLLQKEGMGGVEQVEGLLSQLKSLDPARWKKLAKKFIGRRTPDEIDRLTQGERNTASGIANEKTDEYRRLKPTELPPNVPVELDSRVTTLKTGNVTIDHANVNINPIGTGIGVGANGPQLPASLLGIPARAGGGPVRSGEPVLVGEKGPEIFVPTSQGEVISNHLSSRLSSQMPRAFEDSTSSVKGVGLGVLSSWVANHIKLPNWLTKSRSLWGKAATVAGDAAAFVGNESVNGLDLMGSPVGKNIVKSAPGVLGKAAGLAGDLLPTVAKGALGVAAMGVNFDSLAGGQYGDPTRAKIEKDMTISDEEIKSQRGIGAAYERGDLSSAPEISPEPLGPVDQPMKRRERDELAWETKIREARRTPPEIPYPYEEQGPPVYPVSPTPPPVAPPHGVDFVSSSDPRAGHDPNYAANKAAQDAAARALLIANTEGYHALDMGTGLTTPGAPPTRRAPATGSFSAINRAYTTDAYGNRTYDQPQADGFHQPFVNRSYTTDAHGNRTYDTNMSSKKKRDAAVGADQTPMDAEQLKRRKGQGGLGGGGGVVDVRIVNNHLEISGNVAKTRY